jgi:hypothetical protein
MPPERRLIYALINNLNTHKPKNDRWPKQPQPPVPLHADAGVRAEGATLTTRPSSSSERIPPGLRLRSAPMRGGGATIFRDLVG